MKTKNSIIVGSVISSLFLAAAIGFAQGSLTPPGAPAPTMKTLAQVEPRTDILTLPIGGLGAYSITQPGSYYISSNLVGGAGVSGIEIKTNDVTIDLGGFALIGAGGFHGIFANGNSFQRIAVRNGRVTGYGSGIDCMTTLGTNHSLTVEDVQLVGFGSSGGKGITCGDGLQVRRCQISGFIGSGGAAIVAGNLAQLSDCLAQNNYAGISTGSNSILRAVVSRSHPNLSGISVGFDSEVFDCEAISNSPDGIDAGHNSNLGRCLARKNNGFGISVGSNATVIACSAIENNGTGISAQQNSLISDCVVNNNGDRGIQATPPATIQNCVVSGNASRGIESGGFISGCSVSANLGSGIFVYGFNSRVVNNQCNANGGALDAGIYVNISGCQVQGNSVTSQTGTGIYIAGGNANCFAVANQAHGNATNYVFVPITTSFGPLVNVSAGGGIFTNSPWVNFIY